MTGISSGERTFLGNIPTKTIFVLLVAAPLHVCLATDAYRRSSCGSGIGQTAAHSKQHCFIQHAGQSQVTRTSLGVDTKAYTRERSQDTQAELAMIQRAAASQAIECPAGFQQISENLDGEGKRWVSAVPTLFACADICSAREGCTGFEYSADHEQGKCGTYTAGGSNVGADKQTGDWLSCIKATTKTTTKFISANIAEQAKSDGGSLVAASHVPAPTKDDVFLIGNGPIAEEDHALLRQASPRRIFRFNGMTNLRLDEPVGRVFVRSRLHGYWGLGCCRGPPGASCRSTVAGSNMCSRVNEATQIIPLGGLNGKQAALVRECAKAKPRLKIKTGSRQRDVMFYNANMSIMHFPNYWSSGFLGLGFIHSISPHSTVHVMGMNWRSGRPGPHPFQLEERLFRSDPKVVVHETPSGKYHPREICMPKPKEGMAVLLAEAALAEGDSLA